MNNYFTPLDFYYEDRKKKKIYPAYEKIYSKNWITYYKKDGKFVRIYDCRAKKYDHNMRYLGKKDAIEKYPQYFI